MYTKLILSDDGPLAKTDVFFFENAIMSIITAADFGRRITEVTTKYLSDFF